MFVSILGYTAAAIGSMLMLPQVIRSWRTRAVDDLSFAMVLLYVTNCALWLAYGVLTGLPPVWLTNAIALAISLAQLALKLRYGRVSRQ